MTKAIVVLSGGMDSTTALYLTVEEYSADEVHALSFDYGQRHVKELEYAAKTTEALKVKHHFVDLRSVTGLFKGSALTDSSVEVPEGHYADETMKATVVPNRNMIMLSIASGVAVAEEAERVVIGVHAGDHPIYPDCRVEAIVEVQSAVAECNDGFVSPTFAIWAPYINSTKDVIVEDGDQLGVNWKNTWSCYNGRLLHCGKCGTCVERREAFQLAGVEDPTQYELDIKGREWGKATVSQSHQ